MMVRFWINKVLRSLGYQIVKVASVESLMEAPKPLEAKPDSTAIDLGGPLSEAEIVGAYKVLAYLHPNEQSLRHCIERNRTSSLLPNGVFLTLLEYDEVQQTLFLPQIRENSLPFSFQMNFGATLFGYSWDRFVSIPASVTGDYEPDIQQTISRHLSSAGTAIDVGANIGCHTSLMCEIVGQEGRVLAIEPVQAIFALLTKVKAVNHYSQLEILNIALSDREGIAAVEMHKSNLGGNTVRHVSDSKGNGASDAPTVQVRRLDAVARHLARIDLIKIDVEGFEGYVLDGAWELIERHKPAVIMEFAPGALRSRGTDPTQLLERFRQMAYVVRQVGRTEVVDDIRTFVAQLEVSEPFVNLELVPSSGVSDQLIAGEK